MARQQQESPADLAWGFLEALDQWAHVDEVVDAGIAQQLREWAQGLGVNTFVGSSGRVFPTDMKAAPLLRAWLHRLRSQGVHFHVRHRWLGWSAAGDLRFATPDGEKVLACVSLLHNMDNAREILGICAEIDRLEAEADRTGDRTKVIQYRKALKQKG